MADKKNIIAIAMFIMAMVVLTQCNWKKEFLPEVSSIDALSSQLDSIVRNTKQIDTDTLEKIHSAVLEEVMFVQNHFNAEMRKPMAEKISAYRNIPNLLPHPSDQWMTVLAACSVSKQQLQNLKNVIVSESNQDSLGNNIDATYLKEAIQAEKIAAQKSIELFGEFNRLYGASMEQYSQYHNDIQFWIDSLQTQMNP